MCKKAFFSKTNVKQHDQRVHGEVRLFKCDLCNKSFAFEQDLKHHSIVHSKESRYQCDVCNMSFLYLLSVKERVQAQ